MIPIIPYSTITGWGVHLKHAILIWERELRAKSLGGLREGP